MRFNTKNCVDFDYDFSPRTMCFNTWATGYGDGIVLSQERGANASVTVSTAVNIADTKNTSYAGQSGIIADGNVAIDNRVLNTYIDPGALTLANAAVTANTAVNNNALNLASRAIDTVAKQALIDLQFAQAEGNANRTLFRDLTTYTNEAYTSALGGVASAYDKAVNRLGEYNSDIFEFFGEETVGILEAQRANTTQLQNATVTAIKSAADATSSENFRGFTNLQDTLVKIALGGGALIVAFVAFSRMK